MKLNSLTPEEKKVIVNKGTEAPYSGEYDKFNQEGVYTCRRCNANLYRSQDKFDSHCGWPSFDAEIAGAVKRNIDADGRRTEIICARCEAHLGHVFEGEGLTDKNVRHCANSLSMRFIAKNALKNMKENAYFGGGCFWCIEASFKIIKGVSSVMPGFAGGKKENPTYEGVSSGATGHAEVVKIEYDSTIISFEGLLEVFFAIHDPTTLNRQGGDVGTQYRSIILYADDLQKEIAENFIEKMTKEKVFDSPIITEVKPLEKFYEAEEYHHDYFAKNPTVAYCQVVIAPKITKLRKNLKNYLK